MTNITVKAKIRINSTAEEIYATILKSRGFVSVKEQENFLNPPKPELKYLLKESKITLLSLKKFQKILTTHLKSKNDICIFGDYDADGVTATATMWQTVVAFSKLNKSTSRILPFIPDRHRHGYGLGEKAVADLISGKAFSTSAYDDFKPRLVITVDTGIVAHDGINKLIDSGIEVMITDHHLPLSLGFPESSCVVHTTKTSGAGVAWIISMFLLGDSAQRLLDIATIGVVGDMMPLISINRSICIAGLTALSKTKRPGLIAMKKQMGVGDKQLTTYDISFGIAPRINAAGRIYNPQDALRLLCTSDPDQAMKLAATIESHNKDRQNLTDQALLHATTQNSTHNVILIIGDYHEGIIGLVAGKLTELYSKPAIVISANKDALKGSARSVPGINITDFLRSLKTPFLGLGGHDQAAGFSISPTLLEEFKAEVLGKANQLDPKLLIKHYSADLELPLNLTNLKLAKLLESLEPYGMANSKPKFLFIDLEVLQDKPLGKDGQHHKLTVMQNNTTREVLVFNSKHKHPLKSIKYLIANLDINVWQGNSTLQLIASYVET